MFEWACCNVLVRNDSRFTGLVLVPALPNIRSLDDMRSRDQAKFINEVSRASRLLKEVAKAKFIHVAMLSDSVKQFHAELIARSKDDSHWPECVFGSDMDRTKLDSSSLRGLISDLKAAAAKQNPNWSDTGMDLHPKDAARSRPVVRKPCTVCKAADAQFVCGNCQAAHYCGTECQSKDWPRHFTECRARK